MIGAVLRWVASCPPQVVLLLLVAGCDILGNQELDDRAAEEGS